jgi:osmotically-inducible protein OsmY
MGDRHQHDHEPHDRDRDPRDQYGRDDRGLAARAGDEVRSWFGDEDAARRRRLDEEHEHRVRGPRRSERGYGGSRDYPNREDGWRDERDYDPWRDRQDFDEEWRSRSSSRDYSGIGYGLSGGHRDDARVSPGGRGLEAGYLGYGRRDAAPAQSSSDDLARRQSARSEWRREYSSEWWRVPGPHVGRGPRNYRRSDERIREELNDRLTAHGLIDASDIECQVQEGIVTLAGFVGTRAEKRAAEDLAEDVSGVLEVHNQLKLRSNSESERDSAALAESGRSRTRS